MKENLLLLKDLLELWRIKFLNITAISKNDYFDVLDDIVNKHNNTIHRTIKMKSIDVKDDLFAEYNDESNKRNPKFKVG